MAPKDLPGGASAALSCALWRQQAGSHALRWTLLCPLPFWTTAEPFGRGLLAQ